MFTTTKSMIEITKGLFTMFMSVYQALNTGIEFKIAFKDQKFITIFTSTRISD